MITVGIDARAWSWTGIGRYVRNLLRELVRQAAEDVTFVVFVPPRYAREAAALPRVQVIPVRDSYYSLYEQTGFLLELLRRRVDLMHFLNFNVPVLYPFPFVVTIHDLTRFHFPGTKHRNCFHQWAYGRVFRAAVERSRALIAVSQATADELGRFFPPVLPKTTVVTEGVEERFFSEEGVGEGDAAVLRRLGVTPPYLLYVGLWLPHKNLPGLLRAFRLIRRAGFPGTLVITGEGRPWDEDVPGLAAREGVSDAVLFPGPVSEEELVFLYRRASLFLFPSRSEGFGLPPLEAMALGTPVVAARAGSLPEILGDAALLVDPGDPQALADAVLLVLTDAPLRERLTARGRARARQFSWSACAQETLAVYTRALGQSATLARSPDAASRRAFSRESNDRPARR